MRTSPARRLSWLDCARAVAALVVVFQHYFESESSSFHSFTFDYFNFGQIGVVCFFLVSGFVIPLSLEKSSSVQRFWLSRVFRLYPLYWTSLAFIVIGYLNGWLLVGPGFDMRSSDHLLANVTMLQGLVGLPNALSIYWTLGVEMAFYILCSFFFVTGLSKATRLLPFALTGVIALLGIGMPVLLNQHFPFGTRASMILFAMLGTLVFRYHEGKTSLASVVWMTVATLATNAGLVYAAYVRYPIASIEVSALSMILSPIAGCALYFGFFALRARRFPRLLSWLGTISFSIYLMHPFAVGLMVPDAPPFAKFLVAFGKVVALATFTYYFVELPGQRMGKKMATALDTSPVPKYGVASARKRFRIIG